MKGRVDLDTLAAHWQIALDAAQRALDSADDRGLDHRRRELVQERQRTAELLAAVAREAARPAPWLSPVPLSTRMLGLPPIVEACLFDLDGVLTDSGAAHSAAWADVLDELLIRLGERAGVRFAPFDRDADYRCFIDGRPTLDGVHSFLASRGIHLPEGRPGDGASDDTACGLARRKREALARRLDSHGIAALDGARRYLEAAGHAGLRSAVVSASASTLPMLELSGLAGLLDERVDADAIRVEHLRARPAPDVLLSACRRLEVAPEHAVTFTHSPAGVAAGHAAGLVVVGVADGDGAELLRGFGAERVVSSVGALLDRRLAA